MDEFKIDNSTFSAEYGRNSGSIVNIATRAGSNQIHGEAYEYLRNNALDARNFTNPTSVPQSPFKRNQFGGDGGFPIKKDKSFLFVSYEQLLQRQSIPINHDGADGGTARDGGGFSGSDYPTVTAVDSGSEFVN